MEKQIKLKNYLILTLIIVVTFIICLYLFSWLKQYNDVKLSTPVIKDVLQEVKYDNLNDFLRERDFIVIYSCTTKEKKCRSFEKKLVSYIKEYNLNEEIVYLNVGLEKEENNILNKIYSDKKDNNLMKKLNSYPVFFVFSEGTIIDLLSSTKDEILNIEEVENFIEGYNINHD